VEQLYGVCGARDERPHAGQHQPLVISLAMTVLPHELAPGKITNWEQELWGVPRRYLLFNRAGLGALRFGATQRASLPRSAHSITSSGAGKHRGGNSRPRALSFLEIYDSSNLVAAWTVKSAFAVTLRIRRDIDVWAAW